MRAGRAGRRGGRATRGAREAEQAGDVVLVHVALHDEVDAVELVGARGRRSATDRSSGVASRPRTSSELPSGYLPVFSPTRTVTAPKVRSVACIGIPRHCQPAPPRVKFRADSRRGAAILPRRGELPTCASVSSLSPSPQVPCCPPAAPAPRTSRAADGATRHPGAAALAALGNIVFMPVRFALTVVNAGSAERPAG